ncbi:MAG: asparagine synthase (glutamine-hydrolyzing) [Candidatus Nealsonbacteria bacterium]|nr:asparagine synthase (glutamine-hydrolyzing) [Candidatus Nealsonbacteria bacterium]
MCGIVGFTGDNQSKIDASLELLSHRGPDAKGVFKDDKVCLGHTRLSILDLSANAGQPMIEEKNGAVLTYNGEIYNFKELQRDLIERGWHFKSESDTEVLLKGYLQYGIDFFSRLRGMWAFAIYDKQKNLIILSRDCFGIKPLYYAVRRDNLYFASEMKAMLVLLGSVSPNREYFFQFFNLGYFMAPQTCYKEVKKIEPGNILIWDIAKKELTQSMIRFVESVSGDSHYLSFDDAVEALDQKLEDSLKSHFVSDVPVGLLLSGGNDSSLLAALSKKSGFNPVAYNLSIGRNTDSDYARKVSNRLGLELVQEEMSEKSLREQYEKIWEFLDEPFADISIIPTSLIFSVISGKAKVVLSGEGGDELFGGYLRALKMAGKTAVKRGNPLAAGLNGLYGANRLSLEFFNPLLNRLKGKLLDNFQDDIIGSYLKNIRLIDYPVFEEPIRKSLYDSYRKSASPNLFFDRFVYLPNDLMYKADIASMRYSVESRVPLLDKPLFNFIIKEINPMFCLSPKYTKKIILKKVLEKYLPKEFIYRSKKGFAFSFKDHPFPEFAADVKEAMRFHQKNASFFGFKKANLFNAGNSAILIRKYDRFAFALVANWKIIRNIL